MADKRWVLPPYRAVSQLSVHRSQLFESKFKIERLRIQHLDRTADEFRSNSEGAPLKLGFTGGTDDPSMEL
jgi:hypothetical protein